MCMLTRYIHMCIPVNMRVYTWMLVADVRRVCPSVVLCFITSRQGFTLNMGLAIIWLNCWPVSPGNPLISAQIWGYACNHYIWHFFFFKKLRSGDIQLCPQECKASILPTEYSPRPWVLFHCLSGPCFVSPIG